MSIPKNIGDYLRQFAIQLEEKILQQFPPLHQPGEPLPPELARLRRKPYPAQALAVAAIAKRWDVERSAGAIVTSSKSWPDRPHLWFISLRPNYGLTSTAAHWIQQTTGIRRTVRVHSAALPQSLTAKGRY